MPGQKATGSVFAKLGERGRQAHNTAVQNPVQAGNAGLPAGIEGGIAQLIDIHFGEYKDGQNKGKPFFMAAAIVKSPADFNGTQIAGLRTQIGPEPLCDTPAAMGKRKTVQDHYDWMINQIGLLMGVPPGQTVDLAFDDVEPTCQQLVADAPLIRFRTWSGSKQTTGPFAGREPRVQHEWNGRYDGAMPTTDPAAGVTEAPVEQEPFNEFNQEPAPAEEPAADEAATEDGGDEVTWEEIAAQADLSTVTGSEPETDPGIIAARDQLIGKCQELGINHEELDEQGGYVYPSWGAIAEAIVAAEEQPAEEPVPEPAPPPPPKPAAKPAPKPIAKAPPKPAPKPAAPAKKPAAPPAKKPAGRR